MVERLGFGEKRGFKTGDQLIQMVGGRFFFDHNMQAGTGQCNAEDRGLLAGRTVDLRGRADRTQGLTFSHPHVARSLA
jgi:hypothetical protein